MGAEGASLFTIATHRRRRGAGLINASRSSAEALCGALPRNVLPKLPEDAALQERVLGVPDEAAKARDGAAAPCSRRGS